MLGEWQPECLDLSEEKEKREGGEGGREGGGRREEREGGRGEREDYYTAKLLIFDQQWTLSYSTLMILLFNNVTVMLVSFYMYSICTIYLKSLCDQTFNIYLYTVHVQYTSTNC